MEIQHALAVVRADAARIARYIERRERFLDGLDWSMLSGEQARQSAMLDDLLDEDLAGAILYIDWLVERLATDALPLPVCSALRRIRARGTLNGLRCHPDRSGDQKMSRHTFAGRAGVTVAIGWDRPLQTFFVQVTGPHPRMVGEDQMLVWEATAMGELPTAAAAIALAAPYADLPETLGATLETDRLKTVATFDGAAQIAIRPFLRGS